MAAEVLKVIVGVFFTLFVSFIIVGYQGILPVLLKEGVYQNLCSNQTEVVESSEEPLCHAQTLRLNLMFTIAVSILNSMCLPVGFIVQYYGPRITCSIGAILIASGAILFSFSSPHFDAYIPGYAMMGAGGPFVAFSMFGLTQLIPNRQGTVFSLIVAAFDGSSGLMFLFWVINKYFHYSIHTIFLFYIILPGMLLVSTFWLFPPKKKPISRDTSLDINASMPLIHPSSWFNPHDIKAVVVSSPFMLIALWSMLYVTTKYFYMGNMHSEVLWITNYNRSQARTAQFVFSILVPFSAVFAPLTSYLMDKRPPHFSVAIMAIISFLTAATSNINIYYLQYATMTFIVFNRFFFFAIAPLILTKMYGTEKGPTSLYGIDSFLAACFNYTNYLWTYLAFNVDDGSFLFLNLILNCACGVIGVIVAVALSRWRDNELDYDFREPS